jgi:Phage integrase, N-terminal SAM-like domain/Arm DNA-binding domain
MRGHIRKRGNSWAVYYERPRDPLTGGRRRTSKTGFRTKQDAQRWLNRTLTQLQDGSHVETSKATLGDFLREDWLPSLSARGLRPTTLASYGMQIENHVLPRLGSVPLQRLTPTDLNRMYAEMLAGGRIVGQGGLSAKSVRYVHTILRRALADAVRWGRATRNPADLADPPKASAARETRNAPAGLGTRSSYGRSSPPSRTTALRLCTCSRRPPAPVGASCSAYGGGTWTWSGRGFLSRRR